MEEGSFSSHHLKHGYTGASASMNVTCMVDQSPVKERITYMGGKIMKTTSALIK
jgi:hypothetical protein